MVFGMSAPFDRRGTGKRLHCPAPVDCTPGMQVNFNLNLSNLDQPQQKFLTKDESLIMKLSRRTDTGATKSDETQCGCSAACPKSQIGKKMPRASISTSAPRNTIRIGSIWLESVLSS